MRAIVLLLAAALCCGSALAAVPREINYQGYLTNPGGAPVNATVSMAFKLYADSSGPVAALHSETQTVAVTNGVFNVLLGAQPANLLVLPFDVPYWLGVKVESDAEMAPRQPVAATGYAIRAASAETLAAGGAVGQVLVGTGSAPVWSDSPSLSGTLTLSGNAGNGTHAFGEYHRDNAIQAWAVIRADGLVYASYGVSSVTHSTGIYTFTLQVGAIDNTKLAAVATPEINAPPISAAAARLISVNTVNGTTIIVYITNGNYVLTDNDFSLIVTGR